MAQRADGAAAEGAARVVPVGADRGNRGPAESVLRDRGGGHGLARDWDLADADAEPDAHVDAHATAHEHAHSNEHSDSDADACAHGDAHEHRDADVDANAHTHSYDDSDATANEYAHGGNDAFAHRHAGTSVCLYGRPVQL